MSTPNGLTALMFAEDWGQLEIADLLKMACAIEDEAVTSITATSPVAAVQLVA